jgi:hypothetical protein
MKVIPLTKGKTALVDDEDYELVRHRSWCAISAGAQSRAWKSGGVRILMHRLILGAEKGQFIDHKNGNRLDNRRANLRFCTQEQNCWNRPPNKGRAFKGVYKVGNRFQARIHFHGKTLHIGSYRTALEAAKKYDVKAREHHGEFAWTNFPTPEEAQRRSGVDHLAVRKSARSVMEVVTPRTRQAWKKAVEVKQGEVTVA